MWLQLIYDIVSKALRNNKVLFESHYQWNWDMFIESHKQKHFLHEKKNEKTKALFCYIKLKGITNCTKISSQTMLFAKSCKSIHVLRYFSNGNFRMLKWGEMSAFRKLKGVWATFWHISREVSVIFPLLNDKRNQTIFWTIQNTTSKLLRAGKAIGIPVPHH